MPLKMGKPTEDGTARAGNLARAQEFEEKERGHSFPFGREGRGQESPRCR